MEHRAWSMEQRAKSKEQRTMTHPEASLGPLGLTSCFTNPYRRQAEFAEGKYRGQGGHRGLVETKNKEQ